MANMTGRGCRCLLGLGVDSQHFDEVGDLLKVAKGVARGLVVAAKEVDVEDVLPRAAAHGTRLDTAEGDVAQGEDAEGLEERAGDVFQGEGYGGLVGGLAGLLLAGDQKEACVIALVVFQIAPQDVRTINRGGMLAGDGSSVAQLLLHEVLHAAGGVVEGRGNDVWMGAEEVATLLESNRVG